MPEIGSGSLTGVQSAPQPTQAQSAEGTLGTHSVQQGEAQAPRIHKSTGWMGFKAFLCSIFIPSALQVSAPPAGGDSASGSVKSTLHLLTQRNPNPRALLDTLATMDNRIAGGECPPEVRRERRETAFAGEVEKLSDMQLSRLLSQMKSGKIADLDAALGYEARPKPGDSVEKTYARFDLTSLSANISLLGRVAASELRARGYADVSDPAPQKEVQSAQALTEASRTAVQGFLETLTSKHCEVSLQPFSPAFAQKYSDEMQKPDTSKGVSDRYVLPTGEDTGVCETFWKDLRRADYRIQDASGESISLIPANALEGKSAEEEQQITMVALQKLKDHLGVSEEQFFAMSQHVHQGLQAGIVAGLQDPPGTPVRVDGKPYLLVWNSQEATYTITKTGDSLAVNAELILNAVTLMPLTGDGSPPLNLDPNRSASPAFRINLALPAAAGGAVRLISGEYNFSLKVE